MNAGPQPAGILSSVGRGGGAGNGDSTTRVELGHGRAATPPPSVQTGHGSILAREVAQENAASARRGRNRIIVLSRCFKNSQ
jgi:hypothetical protein